MAIKSINLPMEIIMDLKERINFNFSKWVAEKYKKEFLLTNEIGKKEKELELLKKEIAEGKKKIEEMKKEEEEKMKIPLSDKEFLFFKNISIDKLGHPNFIEGQFKKFKNEINPKINFDNFILLIKKFKSNA